MSIEYKLVMADDQMPRVIAALESQVALAIRDGWEPFGSLVAYLHSAHTCLIQPMIKTAKAVEEVRVKRQYEDHRRTVIIKHFPDILRAQRIKEERAAGKSWEEIATSRGRAVSTIKGWTMFYSWYKKDIAPNPELKRLYQEYQESHP